MSQISGDLTIVLGRWVAHLANGLAEHCHAVRITLLTPASGELVTSSAQLRRRGGSVPGGEPSKTPSVVSVRGSVEREGAVGGRVRVQAIADANGQSVRAVRSGCRLPGARDSGR